MTLRRIVLVGCIVGGCSPVANEPLFTEAPNGHFIPLRDSAALFQTDSLDYTLGSGSSRWEARIAVLFTNRSKDTVHVANCKGAVQWQLEKLGPGSVWSHMWRSETLGCSSSPIVIRPGERHQLVVTVFGGFEGSLALRFSKPSDITGVYRIVWPGISAAHQVSGQATRTLLSFERRVSNRF